MLDRGCGGMERAMKGNGLAGTMTFQGKYPSLNSNTCVYPSQMLDAEGPREESCEGFFFARQSCEGFHGENSKQVIFILISSGFFLILLILFFFISLHVIVGGLRASKEKSTS